jgi:hypothetical protein
MYSSQSPSNYTRVKLLNIPLDDEELKIAAQINTISDRFRIEIVNHINDNVSIRAFEQHYKTKGKIEWVGKVEDFMNTLTNRSR